MGPSAEDCARQRQRNSGKWKIEAKAENAELVDRAEGGEELLEKPDAGKCRCMPLRIKDAVLESEKRRRDRYGEECDGKAACRKAQRQAGGCGEEAQGNHGQWPAEEAAAEEQYGDISGMVGFEPVS